MLPRLAETLCIRAELALSASNIPRAREDAAEAKKIFIDRNDLSGWSYVRVPSSRPPFPPLSRPLLSLSLVFLSFPLCCPHVFQARQSRARMCEEGEERHRLTCSVAERASGALRVRAGGRGR